MAEDGNKSFFFHILEQQAHGSIIYITPLHRLGSMQTLQKPCSGIRNDLAVERELNDRKSHARTAEKGMTC